MINIENKVYLKFLSPVYIGGAQEKNLVEGLDYLSINGKEYRIIERELFNPANGIDPNELSQAFLSGFQNTLADLIRKNDRSLSRLVTPLKGMKGSVKEIKSFIKSGSNGLAYLPGSSIKGAIRSALAHFLCGGLSQHEPDKEYIRTFENSLFRFFKVSDTSTFQVDIFRSKIGTLSKKDNRMSIFWKESSRDNRSYFNPVGFETTFEAPAVGTLTEFQIKIAQPHYRQVKPFLRGIHPSSALFLDHEGIFPHFFHAMNTATSNYLKREINWFDNFAGDQSSLILQQLTSFKKYVNSDQQCLLHLGAGSGFHAMTGDWQFEDHSKTGTYQGGRHAGKPKYKTRRIAFDRYPNPTYFGPMGFVLLSLTPFSNPVSSDYNVEKHDSQEKQVVEIKPVHRKVQMKNGVVLDGVVKENKMVDVYLPDGTIKTVRLVTGSADPGKIIEVTIYPDGKGNFNQASFKGFKK